MFIAVKSRIRHYGYSVQNTGKPLSWILGPNQQFGWYKYKRDAQQAADHHNISYVLRGDYNA